jgi:hypothetical protein
MPFCTSIAQRTASTTLGRVDQVAAQRPQPRQSAILVGAGQAAEADDVGGEYRRDLAGLLHGALRLPAHYHKCQPICRNINY